MALRPSGRLPPRLPPPITVVQRRKKEEPVLDIPAGLQTQYIRKWDSIPDKYILDNFALEQHRLEKRRVTGEVPIVKTLIEQLINRPLGDIRQVNGRYYDEDDDDENGALARQRVEGELFTIAQLKTVLTNFLNSEATLALFDKVKVCYYPYDEDAYIRDDQVNYAEIFLCKEDITYETDRAVIDKLKRTIFTKISRWRRAKEGY